MNRELKFRAWCKSDFKTKDGALLFEQKEIDGDLYFVCAKDADIKYLFKDILTDSDWIIEQYTGVNDKKGCEIYLGDIISYNHPVLRCYEIGEVIYSSEYLTYLIKFWYNKEYYSLHLYELWVENIEVVGNVYENSELLNKSAQ